MEKFKMLSKNLIEFAAKNYGFDIDDFKVEYVAKWGNPPKEIYTFVKDCKKYIIRFDKVSNPDEYIRKTGVGIGFMSYLFENNVSVAMPLRANNGELIISTRENGENYIIISIEMVSGCHWDKNDPDKWNEKIFFNWGRTMGNMHRLTKDYQPADAYGFQTNIFECLKTYPVVYKAAQELVDEITALPKDKDSFGLIHGDMHPDNFYIDGDKINVFDFGDSQYGWFVLDIGIALFHALWWGRKDNAGNSFTNAIIENFMKGYLSSNRLSVFWISKIPMFMKYRQISAFIPWFFNPEDTDNPHQKEWKYNIENDILFDGVDLKSRSVFIYPHEPVDL